MSCFRGEAVLCLLVAQGITFGQPAPSVPEHPWDTSSAKQPFKAPPRSSPAPVLDPAKIYTLSELVNIAEQNNPDTRVAWENAKGRAAELGIAKSTRYPTLSAAARLRQEIEKHYTASGFAIPPGLTDMITLGHSFPSIVVPLSADIHITFTNHQHAVMHHPQQPNLRAA